MHKLSPLFAPRSIAVVGASQDTNKIRGRLLKVLVDGGYQGAIYPVNPSSATIQGLKAYPSVLALPEPADLALIAVAAPQVMEVLEECARANVKAAAIFTAGPNNVPHGERLQDLVAQFAQRTGMRILGPNAEGFMDIDAGLIATFSPTVQSLPPLPRGAYPKRGGISIVSQSGAMAYAVYSRATADLIPIQHLVSTGNEADIELLEVVDYLISNGTSKAILLFIEGFRNPERFAAVAARAADAGIPLIVAKIGRSTAGQRAAVSHTAHLTGADTAYEAAFRRFGVLRVDNPTQMLSLAAAISANAWPQGKRVAIITTSGGAGGWAADVCEESGLDVPELDPVFKQQLAQIVPDYGSVENPVDVTARVVEDGGSTLMGILGNLSTAQGVDIGLIIMTLTSQERIKNLETQLAAIYAKTRRAIVFHSPGYPSRAATQGFARVGGIHMSLEGFAFSMKALDDYRVFRQQWVQRKPQAKAVPIAKHALLPAAAGTLGQDQARQLLATYGVPMPPEALARTAAEAAQAAKAMGWPVVLKVVSADIPHKTEAGGVALNLGTEEQVHAAFARIMANAAQHAPRARIDGIQVQKMMPPGREMVIGTVNDPDFGPMVMLGFGGIYVEVLRDVVFELAPLSIDDAHRMIRRLKGRALLDGVRGEAPADVEALAQVLVSVSQMIDANRDRIAEVDLNPVLLYPVGQGAVAVDSLIVTEAASGAAGAVTDSTQPAVAGAMRG